MYFITGEYHWGEALAEGWFLGADFLESLADSLTMYNISRYLLSADVGYQPGRH